MINVESLRGMIAEELKAWDQPSISVGIVKDGKVELMPFENIGVRTKKRIEREVEKWFEVKEIRWMEI